MKKILLAAAVLIGISSLGANAQTPGENNKMAQPREFTEFAFEGILLDIDQQQKIDSINAVMKPNGPVQQCEGCPNADACKKEDCKKEECKKEECKNAECKQGTDASKDKDGNNGRMRPNPRDRKGAKGQKVSREYVDAVKAVLTPEQYTLFLENVLFMPQPEQKMAPGVGRDNMRVSPINHGGRKGQGDMRRGDKKSDKKSDKKTDKKK